MDHLSTYQQMQVNQLKSQNDQQINSVYNEHQQQRENIDETRQNLGHQIDANYTTDKDEWERQHHHLYEMTQQKHKENDKKLKDQMMQNPQNFSQTERQQQRQQEFQHGARYVVEGHAGQIIESGTDINHNPQNGIDLHTPQAGLSPNIHVVFYTILGKPCSIYRTQLNKNFKKQFTQEGTTVNRICRNYQGPLVPTDFNDLNSGWGQTSSLSQKNEMRQIAMMGKMYKRSVPNLILQGNPESENDGSSPGVYECKQTHVDKIITFPLHTSNQNNNLADQPRWVIENPNIYNGTQLQKRRADAWHIQESGGREAYKYAGACTLLDLLKYLSIVNDGKSFTIHIPVCLDDIRQSVSMEKVMRDGNRFNRKPGEYPPRIKPYDHFTGGKRNKTKRKRKSKNKTKHKRKRRKKPKKKRKTVKVDRVEKFLKNFRKYDGNISKLKKTYKK